MNIPDDSHWHTDPYDVPEKCTYCGARLNLVHQHGDDILCTYCVPEFLECEGCGCLVHEDGLGSVSYPPDGVTMCPDCRMVESFVPIR